MGKKIYFEASDAPCMFQFFKQFVHQTEKMSFIMMVDMFAWVIQE